MLLSFPDMHDISFVLLLNHIYVRECKKTNCLTSLYWFLVLGTTLCKLLEIILANQEHSNSSAKIRLKGRRPNMFLIIPRIKAAARLYLANSERQSQNKKPEISGTAYVFIPPFRGELASPFQNQLLMLLLGIALATVRV